jgi:hypothetical protein
LQGRNQSSGRVLASAKQCSKDGVIEFRHSSKERTAYVPYCTNVAHSDDEFDAGSVPSSVSFVRIKMLIRCVLSVF